MTKTLLTLVALVFAASILADSAGAAEAKSTRHKQQPSAKPATAEPAPEPGFRQQPARMIEVRPGVWVSSYGCVQDEGYGRYNACDITDGMH